MEAKRVKISSKRDLIDIIFDFCEEYFPLILGIEFCYMGLVRDSAILFFLGLFPLVVFCLSHQKRNA